MPNPAESECSDLFLVLSDHNMDPYGRFPGNFADGFFQPFFLIRCGKTWSWRTPPKAWNRANQNGFFDLIQLWDVRKSMGKSCNSSSFWD